MLSGLLLLAACNFAPKGSDNPSSQAITKHEQGQSADEPEIQSNQALTQRENVRECCYAVLDDKPIIKAEIKGNDVMLWFDREEFMENGFGAGEAYCLPDTPVKVENLKGKPQSVFIGDIGTDPNPILCVLLENGDVQILSLFDCVGRGDLEASPVLLHGVNGIKKGGGGAWKDGNGKTLYSYTTIYAVTDNKEEEIRLCNSSDCLQYAEPSEGSVAICQLRITQDWKMSYVLGWEESELAQMMKGSLWAISEDNEKMVFRYGYEMTQMMDFEDEFEPKLTEISQKGVFELRQVNGACTVTPIEGIDFAGKGLNVPVKFEILFGF